MRNLSRSKQNLILAKPAQRALVLGTGGSKEAAHRIFRQLEALGIIPMLEDDLGGEPLGGPSEPGSLARLDDLLSRFRQKAGPSPGPYSDWLHPGIGSWAERTELASVAQRHGMSVIAPPAKALSYFSNRLNLLQKAEELGIPNLIVSQDPMHSLREIEQFMTGSEHRLPFVLKSAKGGSRFGITVIYEPQDLESKLPLWLEQLRKNYGEVILFAERYIEEARHITIPFCRFLDGRTQTFPAVDASLQCRHRKVVEFCPAESIDPKMDRILRQWAVSIADACGFVGVGSLEFLVDGSRAFLIHGLARLNTGFHLWEKVAGTSAVAWQLAAMQGGAATLPPEMKSDKRWKSGVSLRLYAEDSILQLPQPGMVREVSDKRHWDFPTAEVELDLPLQSGEEVTARDQGMIGSLWAGAQDRSHALAIARGVLDEVWVAGSLQTNERFLSELLLHPWIKEGIFHVGFVDEEFLPALRPPAELIGIFVSVLAELPDTAPSLRGEIAAQYRWAVGDQWSKAALLAVEWLEGPRLWKAGERDGLSGKIRVPDGRAMRVCAYPLGADKWQVRIGSWVMITRRALSKAAAAKAKTPPRISSLVSGRVHSVLFRAGASVPAHEPMLIIESLGMLVPHALPIDVRVNRWKVSANDRVAAGQDLAEFEVLAKS